MKEGEACVFVAYEAVGVGVLLDENVTGGVRVCRVVVSVAGLIISEDLEMDGEILEMDGEIFEDDLVDEDVDWGINLEGLKSSTFSCFSCTTFVELEVSFEDFKLEEFDSASFGLRDSDMLESCFRNSFRLLSCILFFRLALPNSSSSSFEDSFLSFLLSSSLSELFSLFLGFNFSFLVKKSRPFLEKISALGCVGVDFSFSFSLSFGGLGCIGSGEVRGSSQHTLHLHFLG